MWMHLYLQAIGKRQDIFEHESLLLVVPFADVLEKFVFGADFWVALQVVDHLREQGLAQAFEIYRL